jgi:pyridoxal biosynthesis lyase PdxS
MKKPREVLQPRWGVYALRKRAERIGFVEGPRDAEEAVQRAFKECAAQERERWRISVQREA